MPLGVIIKDYLEITFLLGSNMSYCSLLMHVFGMPDDKILPSNLEEREMKSLWLNLQGYYIKRGRRGIKDRKLNFVEVFSLNFYDLVFKGKIHEDYPKGKIGKKWIADSGQRPVDGIYSYYPLGWWGWENATNKVKRMQQIRRGRLNGELLFWFFSRTHFKKY